MRSFRPRYRPSSATPAREGAQLVEMAFVLPLFFMVILAIVEFGRAMMVANLLTNAAREGARMAIVSGTTNSEVETAVTNQVVQTVGVASNQVNVDIYVSTYPSGSPVLDAPLTGAQKRDLCDVHVKVLYDDVSVFPVRYLSGVSLLGQAAMRHE